MRGNRIKVEGVGVYHCISRVVAGEHLLDDAAKEVFRKMLWRVSAFCGVEVLTYCVMSNHVHLLVRVDSSMESLDGPEILRRYRNFYGEMPRGPGLPSYEVLAAKFAAGGEEAERWERRLRARMGDVSEFMKMLKQRFTIWFNQSRRRFGTLWSERFKSVLVEDSLFAVKTVAAYIDLNPVRAGLVEDPGKYRWSSYAEALGGSSPARSGIAQVTGERDWRRGLEHYRMALFGKGAVVRKEGQRCISEAAVKEVLSDQGRIAPATLLRCRVRYFTEGGVLGSRSFVERVGRWVDDRKREKSRLGRIPLEADEVLVSWRRPRGQSVVELSTTST